MPMSPSNGLPLKTTIAHNARSIATVNPSDRLGDASETSNGAIPSTINPPKSAATTTAPSDESPSSAQYTSLTRTQRANSTNVNPYSTPKATANFNFPRN